ncbi:MAG: hypothetical protein ACYCO9_15030 [Streptosporangiaceae bacterium]
MTVSTSVMSAGDGYKYLLQSVAAGDGHRDPVTNDPLGLPYFRHKTLEERINERVEPEPIVL